MKRIIFYTLFFLCCIFIYSCKDDEKDCSIGKEFTGTNCKVTPVCGKANDIIGKWKLVKTKEAYSLKNGFNDYSCDEVIYEFRTDNKLVVTSNIEEQLNGEYKFNYKGINDCPTCLPAENLQIDGLSLWGLVSTTTLDIHPSKENISTNSFQKYQLLLIRIK